MLAVERHVPEKWVKPYIARWLACPVMTKSGKLFVKQGKGTPQGGVISPLLANLFPLFGFDRWLNTLLDNNGNKMAETAFDILNFCFNWKVLNFSEILK